MSLLFRWGLNIAGIIITAYIVSGFEVTISGAIIGSLVFGFINSTIRPVLIFLTLPINLITLGLFTFVINAFLLWLVSQIVSGFYLESFGAAILTAIILMLVSSIVNFFIKDRI